MFCQGMAALSKVEEIEIDKQESDMLAASIANVMAEFDITPDPKIAAIAGLVSTVAVISGPRILTYRIRTAETRKSKKPAPVREQDIADRPFTMNNLTG